MHRTRHQHAATTGQPLRHQYRFGRGGRSVVHRRVCHFLPGQLAHQSLKFENGLQRTLGDLCLIRRVGSQKLATQQNRVRDHGTQMLVNAGSQKARIAERVFVRALLEIINDFGFGKWSRQFQRATQPVFFWDGLEQLVDRLCANRG